ncbi:type II secretion system protein [Patescibacteria group bacterium]
MQKNKGFTLIELIVVMAILAIIAGGLIGNFFTSQRKARDAERKSDLKQIQNALEMYANDHNGLYPPDNGAGMMIGCPERTVGASLPCQWAGVGPDRTFEMDGGAMYLSLLPGDPSGNLYFYEASDDRLGYWLLALIENEDDDCFLTDFCNAAGFTVNSIDSNCGNGELCNYLVTSSNLSPP